MSAETKMNVEEEVVQPVETEIVPESASSEPQKGSKEYNFRELERRLDEEKRHRLELENFIRSQQQPQAADIDDEDDLKGLDSSDYVNRKQVEALALRKAEELLRKQEIATLEDRTRLKFRDYDDVMTDKNIEELIENDSDLADSLKRSSNPYATAYKLIKKSAFYQGKGNKFAKEEEKMAKNSAKPISSQTVPNRPLAGANEFAQMSQAQRNELYREMTEAAGRRN